MEDIKQFLRNKPGYLKEGGRRLQKILFRLGIDVTVDHCKQAIYEVNQEFKSGVKIPSEGKILILDIETSPNIGWFWRAGYKQDISFNQIIKERAIICASYKWLDENQVYNLSWDSKQDDKFLVEALIDVMNEADLIVAHNGDRFDIKWIKTRALYHNIETLPTYKTFDTLKVAKSKLYLNSNALDYISKFLGYEGKLPIAKEVWSKVIMQNDLEAMKTMIEYCDEDIIQLEKVYNKLKYLDNPRFHQGVQQGLEKETSPINGSTNIELVKTVTTKSGTIKHIMKDLTTGRFFEMSDRLYNKIK